MRKQNWPELLAAEIGKARHLPFQWGQHDCALWCANVILAMTGEDHAEDLRGAYDSEAGAYAALAAAGYPSLTAMLDDHFDTICPTQAQRGDVVMLPEGAAGICDGSVSWFVTPDGLRTFRTNHITSAWRVP